MDRQLARRLPHRLRVTLAIALALLPSTAYGQSCLGVVSLDPVTANLLGEYRSADGTTAAGVGIAFRVGQRSFVSADYARSMSDELAVADTLGITFATRATTVLGGYSATDAHEFARLQLDAGVQFSDLLAVRPSVVVPIGLGEPTPVLVLTVGLGVGRR